MWGFSCCLKRDSFFLAWYTSKTNTDMLDKCCKVIIFIEKRKKSKICLENLTKVNMIADVINHHTNTLPTVRKENKMVDLVMMILTIISTIATVWSAIKPSSCESVRLEKGVVLNNNRTIIVQNITYGNVGNSTYNSCAGLLFLCALLAVASFVHQYFHLVLAVVVMSSVAFAVNMKCGKHEIYFPASRKMFALWSMLPALTLILYFLSEYTANSIFRDVIWGSRLADLEMIVFEAGILLVSAILIMQQLFASILPLLSANKRFPRIVTKMMIAIVNMWWLLLWAYGGLLGIDIMMLYSAH